MVESRAVSSFTLCLLVFACYNARSPFRAGKADKGCQIECIAPVSLLPVPSDSESCSCLPPARLTGSRDRVLAGLGPSGRLQAQWQAGRLQGLRATGTHSLPRAVRAWRPGAPLACLTVAAQVAGDFDAPLETVFVAIGPLETVSLSDCLALLLDIDLMQPQAGPVVSVNAENQLNHQGSRILPE